jgi:XTP/dITP diphosphohydrolase
LTGKARIWVATGNPKKEKELLRILPSGVQVATILEAPGGKDWTVVEDAPDFLGNARKKALSAHSFLLEKSVLNPTDLVLADDSGLCVEAIGGRPGINSARYAGEKATDADRVTKLLSELRGVLQKNRTAHFTCALVAVCDGVIAFETEENCKGQIGEHPSGSQGFGYDPIFFPLIGDAISNLSFAESSPKAKDELSHRGKALRRFADFYRDLDS